MDSTVFDYLLPTDTQKATMQEVRAAFAELFEKIDPHLPEGPDKTYLIRKLRECAMWSNVTITRHSDGSPR
jgi:hypothetical protein